MKASMLMQQCDNARRFGDCDGRQVVLALFAARAGARREAVIASFIAPWDQWVFAPSVVLASKLEQPEPGGLSAAAQRPEDPHGFGG